jgi:hypothetical protein
MITTTLNRIRDHHPCEKGWRKLLAGLGKTRADDEPVAYATILRINGLDDALWCMRVEPRHTHLWRIFAVRCARRVEHLMTDQRSKDALDVAERYANGQATDTELAAAGAAAGTAAWAAARAAAKAAAKAAAWDAARAAAWAAAWDAARAAAWAAAWDAARAAAWATAKDAARAAAWAAARAAAWDAEQQAQTEILIDIVGRELSEQAAE